MNELTMTTGPTRKRMVFEDTARGVFVLGGDEMSDKLPVTAGPFDCDGRVVPLISLVKVTRRCAFYREPMVPKSYGSMNPEQR